MGNERKERKKRLGGEEKKRKKERRKKRVRKGEEKREGGVFEIVNKMEFLLDGRNKWKINKVRNKRKITNFLRNKEQIHTKITGNCNE